MITHWKDLSEDYDEKDDFKQKMVAGRFPKMCRLGPQNGSESLGPEKLKEAMVGVQVELVGGHQYPPRSFLPP